MGVWVLECVCAHVSVNVWVCRSVAMVYICAHVSACMLKCTRVCLCVHAHALSTLLCPAGRSRSLLAVPQRALISPQGWGRLPRSGCSRAMGQGSRFGSPVGPALATRHQLGKFLIN